MQILVTAKDLTESQILTKLSDTRLKLILHFDTMTEASVLYSEGLALSSCSTPLSSFRKVRAMPLHTRPSFDSFKVKCYRCRLKSLRSASLQSQWLVSGA